MYLPYFFFSSIRHSPKITTIAIFETFCKRKFDLEENQNIIRNFIYDDVPQEQYIIVIE